MISRLILLSYHVRLLFVLVLFAAKPTFICYCAFGLDLDCDQVWIGLQQNILQDVLISSVDFRSCVIYIFIHLKKVVSLIEEKNTNIQKIHNNQKRKQKNKQ